MNAASTLLIDTCSTGVTTITLNRPEARNAIKIAMHHELQAAFDALSPAPVIAASKEVMLRGLAEPNLEAAMRNQGEYPGYVAMDQSEDLLEVVRAFAEKRRPEWKGR